MFCTACNTPWYWDTGLVAPSSAVIHNPHYFEFLAKKRRSSGARLEVVCGEDVTAEALSGLDWIRGFPDERTFILRVFRVAAHLSDLREYTRVPAKYGKRQERRIENEPNFAIKLRILRGLKKDNLGEQSILGSLSEDEYKRKLAKLTKTSAMEDEMMRIRADFFACMRDVLGTLFETERDETKFGKVIREIEELRVLTNNAFREVNKMFNCRVTEIDGSWNLSQYPPQRKKKRVEERVVERVVERREVEIVDLFDEDEVV
jgi:hypothetical protein